MAKESFLLYRLITKFRPEKPSNNINNGQIPLLNGTESLLEVVYLVSKKLYDKFRMDGVIDREDVIAISQASKSYDLVKAYFDKSSAIINLTGPNLKLVSDMFDSGQFYLETKLDEAYQSALFSMSINELNCQWMRNPSPLRILDIEKRRVVYNPPVTYSNVFEVDLSRVFNSECPSVQLSITSIYYRLPGDNNLEVIHLIENRQGDPLISSSVIRNLGVGNAVIVELPSSERQYDSRFFSKAVAYRSSFPDVWRADELRALLQSSEQGQTFTEKLASKNTLSRHNTVTAMKIMEQGVVRVSQSR